MWISPYFDMDICMYFGISTPGAGYLHLQIRIHKVHIWKYNIRIHKILASYLLLFCLGSGIKTQLGMTVYFDLLPVL